MTTSWRRLLLGFLVFPFSQCDHPKHKTRPKERVTAPISLELPPSSPVDTSYRVDTVAVLTSRRLDALLTDLQQAHLVATSSVQALPAVVTTFLSRAIGETFTMAEPGQKYQATDIIMEEGLPRRQLLYLGQGDNMLLLTYNLGGFGLSQHVILVKLKEEKILDFWTGYMREKLTDKDQIISYLRANKDKKWGVNTNLLYF